MRAFAIGVGLALVSHTLANPRARIDKEMGKTFMPVVAPPPRAGHMSLYPGTPVALVDRAPVVNFPVSRRDKSIALLRREIFKFEETSDRMKAELKSVRSRMAIMAQAMPIHTQMWTRTAFCFRYLAYGICAAFLFFTIYKVFIWGIGRVPAISMNPAFGAKLQSPAATSVPLILSHAGLRTAVIAMGEGKGLDGGEAMRDPAPFEAGKCNVDARSPRIFDPFPESTDYLAMVLVTRGLEDLAMNFLVQQQIVPTLAHLTLLPRPDAPAIGEASLDKVVVRLGSDHEEMKRRLECLQAAPVVQAVLAFVAAADELETFGGWEERNDQEKNDCGIVQTERREHLSPEGRWAAFRQKHEIVPTGILDQLGRIVSSATRWPMAEAILQATGVGPIHRFRASCITSGRTHSGFDCMDAMKTVGGGVLSAHAFKEGPGWKVDLERFEVEVYGFVFHDTFACGLLLGGQWRRNINVNNYSFSNVPFGERLSRPYTDGDFQPWFMPRLRPSTSVLLLLLADLEPGLTLLDPMGGCGTIAIEAAVQFEGICALTSDNNSIVTSAAINNCELARPHLAAGSTINAKDWDARSLVNITDASIDRIVTDMPFGNKCRWDAAADLSKILGEIARVLKRGGKAVLLMKGFRRVEALLNGVPDEEDIERPEVQCLSEDRTTPLPLKIVERRPIGIGGYLCYGLVLLKT